MLPIKNKNSCTHLLLGILLLCLSACGVKQDPVMGEIVSYPDAQLKASKVTERPGDAIVCRSKWSDMPLPFEIEEHLHDRLKALLVDDERGCVFSFSTSLSFNDGKIFYLNELEREGWSQRQLFDLKQEVLMAYEKPSKMIIVRITSHGSGSDIHVYVSSKYRKEKGHESVPFIIFH
jgi:hypothetical protein